MRSQTNLLCLNKVEEAKLSDQLTGSATMNPQLSAKKHQLPQHMLYQVDLEKKLKANQLLVQTNNTASEFPATAWWKSTSKTSLKNRKMDLLFLGLESIRWPKLSDKKAFSRVSLHVWSMTTSALKDRSLYRALACIQSLLFCQQELQIRISRMEKGKHGPKPTIDFGRPGIEELSQRLGSIVPRITLQKNRFWNPAQSVSSANRT